jgi:hypothetical protein
MTTGPSRGTFIDGGGDVTVVPTTREDVNTGNSPIGS